MASEVQMLCPAESAFSAHCDAEDDCCLTDLAVNETELEWKQLEAVSGLRRSQHVSMSTSGDHLRFASNY